MDWWPAETSFEMMMGAVLVQHTAWENVGKSLDALRQAGLLHPAAMAEAEYERVKTLINPSGFMTAKARTCIALAQWLLGRATDAADVEPSVDPGLRDSLLTVTGVGPETADVIRLYAFGQKCFIWDLYSRRLLAAVGYPNWGSYEGACGHEREFINVDEYTLPEMQGYHGLILSAGKRARREGSWDFLR
ncbi:hypothetical protein AB656_05480 [Bifidobacterium actinocoloniiforme DSM 22766]|nr:hypothetical protein AB656_05480 [Bifidobacterium actinocoloniiforme DSM 22766]